MYSVGPEGRHIYFGFPFFCKREFVKLESSKKEKR